MKKTPGTQRRQALKEAWQCQGRGFGGFKGQGGVAQANQNRMMGGTTARASFKQTVSNCQKKLNETKEEKKRA